ncbi:MAG: hypothetical protein ACRD2A_13190 [Vicinamibacterales bacterium]
MLVIIEGTDCTGKSTLAERLIDATGAHLIHRGPPIRHPLEEYVLDLFPREPRVVCDRWHLGELVWPTIYGRDSVYDDAMFNYTEAFLRSRGALVVYCASTVSAIRKRLKARGDNTFRSEHIVPSCTLFENVARRSTLPQLTYSIEHPVPTEAIIQRAGTLTAATKFRTYSIIGNTFDPTLLLVGDQANNGRRGVLPFMPYPSTSGHYLFGLDLDWRRVAVTNAAVDEQPQDMRALWNQLGQPRVVALGSNATKRLLEQDVPHGAVPHPQFVRRFHHDRATRYRDLIVEAADGLDLRRYEL